MRIAPALALAAGLAACAPASGPVAPSTGDDAAAARAYEAALAADPEDPVVRYNLGTVLLRMEDFAAARAHLQVAARSGPLPVRQAAYYNLGNADLVPAFAGRAGGADRERLVRAITAYKRALLLEPGDADAKWNLELARRLLRQEAQSPPPDPDPSAGGGGGGGGGGEDRAEGRQDPRPRPAEGGGPQPPLSREAAERLLASAQEREVGLQREKLRKEQPRSPTAH